MEEEDFKNKLREEFNKKIYGDNSNMNNYFKEESEDFENKNIKPNEKLGK